MGFVYLVILITVVATSFYVTVKAIGDAEGVAGFNIWRFNIQAALAGVPGMLWVVGLASTGSSPKAWIIIFFLVAAIIHILYCIKLFGTRRGVSVTLCSMVAAFIIVILMIFAVEQLKKTFRSLSRKGKIYS